MTTVTELLDLAGVGYAQFTASAVSGIYITTGNQLIGTFADERSFVKSTSDYHGWQAHHVVETQDLRRLNLQTVSPSRDNQLCVLLPERAHIGRINSILRNRVPLGEQFTPMQLLEAYSEAYAIMGDYCGSGERIVRKELVGIVRATLKAHGLV